MYKTSCVTVFTVLALWSWAVQAVVVPQPVGMYITPVQDYVESDNVTVDSRARLAHEGRIRDVMAAQVDLVPTILLWQSVGWSLLMRPCGWGSPSRRPIFFSKVFITCD